MTDEQASPSSGAVSMGELELKPCPFCGGKAEIWRAHGERTAWIGCIGRCSVLVSKEYKTDAEAIAAWNTRALASRPAVAEGEPVAWLKEWNDGPAHDQRSRIDRTPVCEPWLSQLAPRITPLYALLSAVPKP